MRNADTPLVDEWDHPTLVALRSGYVTSLPAKARAIREAAGTARPRDGDVHCEGAVDLAHRLRGSAGLFGFAELSRVAGAIEVLLEQHAAAALVDAQLDSLDDLCRIAALQAPHESPHSSSTPPSS